MAIKTGDTLPADIKLKEMAEGGPKDVTVGEIFKGKKVVLFAVPGAFTPTCSMKHLPGFLEQASAIRAKGVDEIVCLAVNDAFVALLSRLSGRPVPLTTCCWKRRSAAC